MENENSVFDLRYQIVQTIQYLSPNQLEKVLLTINGDDGRKVRGILQNMIVEALDKEHRGANEFADIMDKVPMPEESHQYKNYMENFG